jgi:hypothetical protein
MDSWQAPENVAANCNQLQWSAGMNLRASISQRGKNLGLSATEQAVLDRHACHAQALLDELAAARTIGDHNRIRSLAGEAMSSYDLKSCSVVRHGLKGVKNATLAEIEHRADQLDAFHRVPEPVIAYLREKGDGTTRVVVDFGWRRRSLIDMTVCILDTVFPRFPFDFLDAGAGGYDAATLHLMGSLTTKGHEYVTTVDIKQCFRSATKEKVAAALPLPGKVTRNVILVGKGVEVRVKLPEGLRADSPQGRTAYLEADEAARQGLPQGSPASGLIMRRAVLGPVLAQQSFSDDLALYQDEVAVTSKTKAQSQALAETLKLIFSTSPAGPLTIGQKRISPISEGFSFLAYHTSWKANLGKLHVKPRFRAFTRAEERAATKYLAAGGGLPGLKAMSVYLKRWRRSLRLWNANWYGKLYQWIAMFSAPWGKSAGRAGKGVIA